MVEIQDRIGPGSIKTAMLTAVAVVFNFTSRRV